MGPREPGYWASRWFSQWLLAFTSAQSHRSKTTNPYPVGRQVAIGTIFPFRCPRCTIQANTEEKTHYTKLKTQRQQKPCGQGGPPRPSFRQGQSRPQALTVHSGVTMRGSRTDKAPTHRQEEKQLWLEMWRWRESSPFMLALNMERGRPGVTKCLLVNTPRPHRRWQTQERDRDGNLVISCHLDRAVPEVHKPWIPVT